jgi:NADH dehydrogenase FAD-containing subunit
MSVSPQEVTPASLATSLATVILAGCGYGAIPVMRALRGKARVIAINPYPDQINSGMTTRLLSGRFSPELVKIPLGAHCTANQAEFIQGRVTQLLPQQHCLTVETQQQILTLTYDALLLNVGRQIRRSGIDGLEHAFTSRPMEQLIGARHHIQTCWQKAQQDPDDVGLLTFVVAGGGATGVELMGELYTLCADLSQTTQIPLTRARLILMNRSSQLVPEGSPRFRHLVLQSLQKLGIEILLEAEMLQIRPGTVRLRHHQTELDISCQTTLWAGGLEVPPWLAASGLPVNTDGSVIVEPTLQVQGYPDILALGDCASFPLQSLDPAGKPESLPKLGVYSVRAAPVAAQNLVRWLEQRPLHPFRPQSSVFISVTVGPRVAVMQKGWFVARGSFATLLKNLFDWIYMRQYKSVRWQDFFY